MSEVNELLKQRALDDFYVFIKEVLLYRDLTPDFHIPLTSFLTQTQAPNEMSRRLILLPRSSFKSTIGTIAYPMWRLMHEPNLRILIISDTEKNAGRFMREIQNHFEYNTTFRGLFSEHIPPNFTSALWNSAEMVIESRTAMWREPSIDAIGMGGGAESRHYDIIIGDDTITEKAIHSDTEMGKAIEWTGGLESLLVKPDDEILWIGSRKKRNDLYDAVIDKFGGISSEEIPIGPHAVRKGELLIYSRSAIENGIAVFPERIPLKFLNRLAETDPDRYNSQYANNPIASGTNFFPPTSIQFFDWDDQGLIVHPGEMPISTFSMERMCLYDPSKAEKKHSSKQAILVVAKGSGSFRYILEARVEHFPPDEAVDDLFRIWGRWQPSSYGIEHRGFQGSIKYWLNERTEREGLPSLPVVEWPFPGSPNAQWSKIERIRGLIPLFRAGYVWLAPELRNSELHQQLLYYPHTKWDDGVDCLAMSLDFWPWLTGSGAMALAREQEDEVLKALTGGQYVREPEWDEHKHLVKLAERGYFSMPVPPKQLGP